MKYAPPLFMIVFLSSCIEDFDFQGEERAINAIVIDAEISNLSYADQSALPMDARYFTVLLKKASAVKTVQDRVIPGAEVVISNDLGEHWDYAESDAGKYVLYHSDFRAHAGRKYLLSIRLPDGTAINSDWVALPGASESGRLVLTEELRKSYQKIGGDLNIIDLKGFKIGMELDESRADVDTYLKWDFYTTWIYKAKDLEVNQPNSLCWNTTEQYLKEYVLLKDNGKSTTETELFYIHTELNEKLPQGFSVLIRQSSLSPAYYQFWEDLQKQKKQSELFAPPPYNANANFIVEKGEGVLVFGFFGAVHESFQRWYYDPSTLSYSPEVFEFCPDPPPGAPPGGKQDRCSDCTAKSYVGKVTTQPPWWWDPQ